MGEYDDAIKSKELSVYIQEMLVIMLSITLLMWAVTHIFDVDHTIVAGDVATYSKAYAIFMTMMLLVCIVVVCAIFHIIIMIVLWFVVRSSIRCLYCAREFKSDAVKAAYDKDTMAYHICCPHCGNALGHTRSLWTVLCRPPAL